MTPRPWSDTSVAAQPWLEQHPVAAWLALAAVAVIVALGANLSRGLLETTEGRYVLCAQEMLQSGQWLEPTLDGKPHWTKPPLTYWVLAAGMAVAGQMEEGARLAQAVVFWALLGAVGVLARQWGDGRYAFWAVVGTLTALLPLLGVTFVSTDLLLTLWETLAIACYAASLVRSRPQVWRAWMGLFWGLAFLTKGPPALLPLAALVPWHWWYHRRRPFFSVAGLALFGVVGLGWYAFEALRHPELVSYWLGQEVAARLASDAFHRNPQWWKPFVMYLPLLAAGPMPWILAVRLPARQWWEAIPRPWGTLLLLWVAIPLGVFFVAKSRLPLYVLPLAIPVALACAFALTQARVSPKATIAVVATVAILGVGARLALTYVPLSANMRQLFSIVQGYAPQEVVLVGEKPCYGLQAYAAWEGISFQRIKAADMPSFEAAALGRVFVTEQKQAALVQGRLEKDGSACNTTSWAQWAVIAQTPTPPAPEGSGRK